MLKVLLAACLLVVVGLGCVTAPSEPTPVPEGWVMILVPEWMGEDLPVYVKQVDRFYGAIVACQGGTKSYWFKNLPEPTEQLVTCVDRELTMN